jgi:hypothetical protein
VLATQALWCLFPAIIATLAALIGDWPASYDELPRRLEREWRRAHAAGPFGWVEASLLAWSAATLVLVHWRAWVELPRTHDEGALSHSYFRALRLAVSTLGWINLGFIAACVAIVRAASASWGSDLPLALAVLLIAVLATLYLIRAERVFASFADRRPAPALPPRCEGCGYDLTLTAAEGRCPECGLVASASLSPGRRPGAAWETTGFFATRWARTLAHLLVTPSHFYGRLRCQSAARQARSFAALNAVLIPIFALLWAWTMLFNLGPGLRPPIEAETLAFMLAFVAIGGLLVWVGYRTGGAFVATIWLLRRTLPDARWAERIICYESTFVWVYCAFWGSLATSFMIEDEWLTGAIGEQRAYAMFGMSAEEAVFWAGTALLSFIWLWRYAVAARHVRWANY